MGVRQLQAFIQKYVPNGYIDVSLYEECDRFKRHNKVRPILLIDVHDFLRTIIKDSKELLCGIRHNKVHENCEKFMKELSRIADLIFFNDGPLTDVKLPLWIDRQNRQHEASKKLLDKIYLNTPLDHFSKHDADLPTTISHLEIAFDLAEKYGTLKTAMDRECDAEMAQFACRNSRVLAILSDDTDFLIFSGNWKYFSLQELDHETLKTKEYSRKALRYYLNLNDQELVLLSTLNGNDVIRFDDISYFHKSLRIRNHFDPALRFPALARYIKYHQLCQIPYFEPIVAVSVFKNCTSEQFKKVRDSLAFYDINFESRKIEDATQNFCLEKSYTFVYSILNNLPIKFVFHYFDQKRSDNFYGHINNLFSKQIGVILKDKPVQKYKIVSKMSHLDPKYELLEVDPIIPKHAVPPLIELLDRQQHPEHDKTRFNLLKWLISEEKLEDVDLELIPRNIFHDILTLTYMVAKRFIYVVEADIILLSIKHVEDCLVSKNVTPPYILHPQAFLNSYLFSFCFLKISRCLEVTGLKGLVKLNNFDGMLFNNLYLTYFIQPWNVIDSLGDYIKYRHYA